MHKYFLFTILAMILFFVFFSMAFRTKQKSPQEQLEVIFSRELHQGKYCEQAPDKEVQGYLEKIFQAVAEQQTGKLQELILFRPNPEKVVNQFDMICDTLMSKPDFCPASISTVYRYKVPSVKQVRVSMPYLEDGIFLKMETQQVAQVHSESRNHDYFFFLYYTEPNNQLTFVAVAERN